MAGELMKNIVTENSTDLIEYFLTHDKTTNQKFKEKFVRYLKKINKSLPNAKKGKKAVVKKNVQPSLAVLFSEKVVPLLFKNLKLYEDGLIGPDKERVNVGLDFDVQFEKMSFDEKVKVYVYYNYFK
jgi:hypothetical protein